MNISDHPNCSLDNVISIAEASSYSLLSKRHIRLLLEQGKIRGKKVGRDWVTTREALDEYLLLEVKPGPKPKSKPN